MCIYNILPRKTLTNTNRGDKRIYSKRSYEKEINFKLELQPFTFSQDVVTD